MEDVQEKIEQARREGVFQGQVLQSLSEIKGVLGEMKAKHVVQDEKIDGKVDKKEIDPIKKDVEELKRWRWITTGAGAMIGWFLGKL